LTLTLSINPSFLSTAQPSATTHGTPQPPFPTLQDMPKASDLDTVLNDKNVELGCASFFPTSWLWALTHTITPIQRCTSGRDPRRSAGQENPHSGLHQCVAMQPQHCGAVVLIASLVIPIWMACSISVILYNSTFPAGRFLVRLLIRLLCRICLQLPKLPLPRIPHHISLGLCCEQSRSRTEGMTADLNNSAR
jgi:hypothetical protein